MPKSFDKPLELQYSLPMTVREKTNVEFHQEPTIDDDLDLFTSGMAGTGGSSPFIKDEPDELSFLHNYPPAQQNFDFQMNQQYDHNHNSTNEMSSPMSIPNGNYGQHGMDQQQHMPNNYNLGNSSIGDDELLELDLNDGSQPQNFASSQQGFNQGSNMQFFQNQPQQSSGRPINQQYSNTPEGPPMQSPWANSGFNYGMYGNMQSSLAQRSPQVRPAPGTQYPGSRTANAGPNMNRQPSDSRSPMTPRTPGMSALHLETPQSGSLPSQPINYNTERQKRTSGQWDSNPDSLHSHADTPISSPNFQPSQNQMAEMLKSGKHASLPAKVDSFGHAHGTNQAQDAKRRRRRESHNAVERRRRDNINEKIQELSHLVPQHRLEDEKVRKHIMNNSPLSPTLAATGMSPPQATSLLAGGGRRATSGSISLGIPPEDKDKGPNKGDILNGSVSWTRDLMWALYKKLHQEDEIAEHLVSLGGHWPFQRTEDDQRMRSELMAAMQANDSDSFAYSRAPGSGLRVPGHTNAAGESSDHSHMGTISPQSLSPADHAGGQGMNDRSSMSNDQQYWNSSLKEEDESFMQLDRGY